MTNNLLQIQDIDVDHVSDPRECEDGTYFNLEACACFSEIVCHIYCPDSFPDRPYLNPINGCECISEADYLSIFDHGLGLDCMGGGIEIDRYDSQEDCDALDSNPFDGF